MKKLLLALCFVTLSAFASDIHVLYSPNGGCQKAILDQIDAAKSEVLVQAYSFTSEPIAVALVDAKKRGCNVMVIIDKNMFEASVYLKLKKGKIKLFEDGKHAIAHNKIIIIDKSTIITGSYNFSGAAEKSNAENLLIINQEPDLTKKYIENFDLHLAHSEAK